jgi:hypothetical protein
MFALSLPILFAKQEQQGNRMAHSHSLSFGILSILQIKIMGKIPCTNKGSHARN